MEYKPFLTQEKSKKFGKENLPIYDILQTDQSFHDVDDVIQLRERISKLEILLADQTSDHNNEVSNFHQQISKLHSSFEKNELLRQQLEYELAVTQKECHKEKHSHLEKHASMQLKCKELQESLDTEALGRKEALLEVSNKHDSYVHQTNKQKQEIEKLESTFKSAMEDNENLHNEKIINGKWILELKSTIQEYEVKCDTFEEQRNSHVQTIGKLVEDNDYLSSKEQDMHVKIQDLIEKKNILEEENQKDRAAHLETKFNVDVLNLKINDLEKGLHDEVMLKGDLKKKLLETKRRCNELEDIVKENEVVLKEVQSVTDLNLQQLEENSVIVTNLRNELQQYKHEKYLLTNELNKRATELEQSKTEQESLVKKLAEFLPSLYHTAKEEIDTKNVIDQLRCCFDGLKQQAANANKKLETLQTEVVQLKDVDVEKDKYLQAAEALASKAQRNYSMCQDKCNKYTEKLKDIQNFEVKLQNELKEMHEKYNNVCVKFEKEQTNGEQIKQSSYSMFQIIYELLTGGNIHPSDRSIQLELPKLKDGIIDQIQKEKHTLKQTSQKLATTENELQMSRNEINKLKADAENFKRVNADILRKSDLKISASRDACNEETDKLKQQFEHELRYKENELQKSIMNQHSLMDELKRVQHQLLEYSNSKTKLRRVIQKQDDELKIFYIALNIIKHVMTESKYRLHLLIAQHFILINTINNMSSLKFGVLNLISVLNNDGGGRHNNNKNRHLTGILRFRVIVITVLANNRLGRSLDTNKNDFKSLVTSNKYLHDVPSSSAQVSMEQIFNTICNDTHALNVKTITKPIYLKVKNLKMNETKNSTGSSTVNDILLTVFKAHEDHLKLTDTYDHPKRVITAPLFAVLRDGLNQILFKRKTLPVQYYTCKYVISLMNESILDFTSRLHETEVDRKTLRSHVERYKNERNKMKVELQNDRGHIATIQIAERNYKDKICDLEKQLQRGEVKENDFNLVCNDLNEALKREEELQMLFQQQTQQISAMNDRIERHDVSLSKKDVELTDALKALFESRDQVKLQEISLSNLRQANLNEQSEKQKIVIGMEEKEKLLHQASREKELIAGMFCNILTNFKKPPSNGDFSHELSSKINKVLIEFDDAIGNAGLTNSPEISYCKSAVSIIVDSQRNLLQLISQLKAEKKSMRSKMASLEDDINAHRSHVHRLKHQITEVCQQELPHSNELTMGVPSAYEQSNFIPLSSTQR